MWLQILSSTIFVLMSNASHVPKNGTDDHPDVIVTYAGHAEAVEPPKPVITPKPIADTTHPIITDHTDTVKILIPESFATEALVLTDDDTESVLFVPNEKPVFRNGDYHSDRVSIGDIIGKKTVGDILKGTRVETESPQEDILFISGKNNENVEKPPRRETARNHYVPDYETRRVAKEQKVKLIPQNCTHLDCNNTLKAVCGGKMENRQWKYRVFLNECYFRRVNCDFKYAVNRYRVMPNEFCKTVGSHHSERPFVYNPPLPLLPRETPAPVTEGRRRSFSSRRSLNIDIGGKFCSHACPPTCPEDYSPECAVTSRGQRRVFGNHCKLDYDSCSYGTVWHLRPLSDCVGRQKSDIRQNRAFIGWMQRIGIVDGKGRLMTA